MAVRLKTTACTTETAYLRALEAENPIRFPTDDRAGDGCWVSSDLGKRTPSGLPKRCACRLAYARVNDSRDPSSSSSPARARPSLHATLGRDLRRRTGPIPGTIPSLVHASRGDMQVQYGSGPLIAGNEAWIVRNHFLPAWRCGGALATWRRWLISRSMLSLGFTIAFYFPKMYKEERLLLVIWGIASTPQFCLHCKFGSS